MESQKDLQQSSNDKKYILDAELKYAKSLFDEAQLLASENSYTNAITYFLQAQTKFDELFNKENSGFAIDPVYRKVYDQIPQHLSENRRKLADSMFNELEEKSTTSPEDKIDKLTEIIFQLRQVEPKLPQDFKKLTFFQTLLGNTYLSTNQISKGLSHLENALFNAYKIIEHYSVQVRNSTSEEAQKDVIEAVEVVRRLALKVIKIHADFAESCLSDDNQEILQKGIDHCNHGLAIIKNFLGPAISVFQDEADQTKLETNLYLLNDLRTKIQIKIGFNQYQSLITKSQEFLNKQDYSGYLQCLESAKQTLETLRSLFNLSDRNGMQYISSSLRTITSDKAKVMLFLGRAELAMKKIDSAIQYFSEAADLLKTSKTKDIIDIRNELIRALILRGKNHLSNDAPEKAASDFDAAKTQIASILKIIPDHQSARDFATEIESLLTPQSKTFRKNP